MDFLTSLLASPELIGGVVALVGLALTLVINRAAGAFQAATGIAIEREHRDALHEAIMTAVESAMKHGPDVAFDTLRAHVVQHLRESVPDALTALTPGDTVLDRLIERYSLEVINKLAAEPK